MEHADKAPDGPQHREPAAKRAPGPLAAPALVDNSAQGIALRALTQMMNHSPRVKAQHALNARISGSPHMMAQRKQLESLFGDAAQRSAAPEEELLQAKFDTVQRAEPEEEELLQSKFAPVQRAEPDRARRANDTGLPDNLKTGIEALSGVSLEQVKVHYNSAQPAQLNALAYAQGSDIHLAPGQERHLPHEAWHVVQQAQGRVRPTMQLQDGVPVNDDAGLEREADVMGAKALAPGAQLAGEPDQRRPGTLADRETVQAKFVLTNVEGIRIKDREETVGHLIRALKDKRGELKGYESEGKEADVDTYVDHKRLKEVVDEMFDSKIDHGEVDVDNVQQLALLYFRAKVQLDPKQHEKRMKSARETGAANAQDFIDGLKTGSYVKRVKHSVGVWERTEPAPEKVYGLVILGAGASAAYYIANNLHAIDPDDTLVIGEEQPWRRTRGAKGVVNHPSNMISPQYQGAELEDSEGGLMFRADFSDEVEKIVAGLTVERAKVTSVKKQGYATKYYRIEAGAQRFYARKVVVGLGIGAHQKPDDVKKDEEKQKRIDLPENQFLPGGNSAGPIPRVMDMDVFQRAVSEGRITAQNVEHLVISGPNAGIDVATTALRLKVKKVSWIVSGGGLFLPGTDNVYAQGNSKDAKPVKIEDKTDDNVKINGAFTYYAYRYGSVEVTKDGVTVSYGTETREEPKVFTPKGAIKADIMVYALGPDARSVRDLFKVSDKYNPGKPLALEPIYDVDQRFNRDDRNEGKGEDALRQYYTNLLKLNDRNASNEELAKIKRAVEAYNNVVAKLREKPGRIAEPRGFEVDPARKLPTVLGLQASRDDKYDESSLEIIGGSAYRLADKVEYAYVSKAYQNLLDGEMTRIGIQLGKTRLGVSETNRIRNLLQWGHELALKMEADKTFSKQRYEDRVKFYEKITTDLEEGAHLSTIPDKMKPQRDTAVKLARHCQDMLAEYMSHRGEKGMTGSADKHMLKAPKTLPRNVLLPDQLTTIRAQTEVASKDLPGNLEVGVNLITSDATVIAAHIATKYGNVPPPLADFLTSRIVFDRRHLPDGKAPLPQANDDEKSKSPFNLDKQKDFQAYWNNTLAEADAMFKSIV